METFGERLRAAMLTRGLRDPEELAELAGISVRVARRWMHMRKAHVSAARLAPVARALQVRMIWLSTGESIPQISEVLSRQERELLEVADSLAPAQLRTFIAIGKGLLVK